MKTYYLREFKFLREKLKIPLLFVFILMLLITIGSYIYYTQNPNAVPARENSIPGIFSTEGLHGRELAFYLAINLFMHNLEACVFVTALGLIPFLFLSLSYVLNGYSIGLFMAGTKLKGIGMESFFLSILPHGIFELPAGLYASGVGVFLTIEISKKFLSKYRSGSIPWGNLLKQVCSSFILMIMPLLLIAAFIEVFVAAGLFK